MGGMWKHWYKYFSRVIFAVVVSGEMILFALATRPVFAAEPVISPNPAVTVFVTGAYVTWTTTTAGNSRVDYGTTTSYGSYISSGTSVNQHNLTISDLIANTTYHYKVTSGSDVSGDYTFTTLAEPTGIVKTVKTSGGDYTSLATCMNAASDGRTCLVYSGISPGAVSISTNGASASSPNTALAHDAISASSFRVTSRNYIKIKGFQINGILSTNGASYIIVENNYFSTSGGPGVSCTQSGFANHIWIKNNTFIGNPSASSGNLIEAFGDYYVIEGNWMYAPGEDMIEGGSNPGVGGTGQYFTVRNNIWHHKTENGSEHPDGFQSMGTADINYGLFEGNSYYVCHGSNCHMFQHGDPNSNAPYMIHRYNFAYDHGEFLAAGGNGGSGVLHIKAYNNTALDCNSAGIAYAFDGTGTAKNNILYNTPNYSVYGGTGNAGNNCYPSGSTCQSSSDPGLTNYPYTPAINGSSYVYDRGVAITTTSGTGSNSIALVVADARYFQDGWQSSWASGIYADWIAVGTVSNVAQISSINYNTNTITLASPATWSNGASVWLYKNSSGTRVLNGAAPDIGAYEYIESGSDLTPPSSPGNLTVR
jgi:hypothetical protein